MDQQKPAPYNGEERRRFKRIRINLVVAYREDHSLDVRLRADNQDHQASMIDVSEEGMAVLTDVNAPVGTVLCVRFNLVDEKKTGIDFYGAEDIKGKVLYVNQVEAGKFRIGIQFFNLTRADKNQLRNFVDIVEKKYSGGK